MTAAEAAVERLRAARDEVTGLSLDALTVPELVNLLAELETDRRRQPTVEHRLIQTLRNRCEPAEVGAKNWTDALAAALRISVPRRRGGGSRSRTARTPAGDHRRTAAAKAAQRRRGAAQVPIGPEHVRIVKEFFEKLPYYVDRATCATERSPICRTRQWLGPTEFRQSRRPAGLSRESGRRPAQRRGARPATRLTIHKQDIDGMSKVSGLLDPEARATLDAVFAKLAAPGMCNPDDEKPCVDGEPHTKTVHRRPARKRSAITTR